MPTQPNEQAHHPAEDGVYRRFLERQFEEGMALAASSDLLELKPVDAPADGDPPNRYLAGYRCRGLVRGADGEIREADRFTVGIWLPSDYLRRVDPFEVMTWLAPREIFHPNILAAGAAICVGRLNPGTSLTEILYQVFEIVSWQKVTMREDDALDAAACAWARRHPERFPVDRRPLKRRALTLRVETSEQTVEEPRQ